MSTRDKRLTAAAPAMYALLKSMLEHPFIADEETCDRDLLGEIRRVVDLVDSPPPPDKSSFRNAGKAWSEHENAALLAGYDIGLTVEHLARLHERTVAGIRARLEKHGRIK